MSYARWNSGGGSWYAWGGNGPCIGADGEYSPSPADGPLVLALWHNKVRPPVYITSEEAGALIRGETNLQDLFTVALTPRELQDAARILCEYLDDVADEAREKEGQP